MTCWICGEEIKDFIEFPISVFTKNIEDDIIHDDNIQDKNSINTNNTINIDLRLKIKPSYITHRSVDSFDFRYYNICFPCSNKYLDFRNKNILMTLRQREILGY